MCFAKEVKEKAFADEFEAKQTEYLKTIEAKLGKENFDELIRLIGETQTIIENMNEV